MTQDSSAENEDRRTTACGPAVERLAQRLLHRYFTVLAAVAILVLLDQAAIQPLLLRLNGLAPAINLAGRQRMLSQKLVKNALAIERMSDPSEKQRRREELSHDLALWSRVHAGLQHGDADLHLPGTRSPEIVAAIRDLDPQITAIQRDASRIASGSSHSEESIAAIAALLRCESQYLPRMDRIVGLLEAEARQQVRVLRLLGLALMALILLLLAGMGGFIVRPAAAVIRDQLRQLTASEQALRRSRDELERRVAERTRSLNEANAALRSEMAERARVEEQARRVLAQLAHVSRVRATGQLAMGLAHELNQPLTTIAVSAETADLLLDHNPPDLPALRGGLARIRTSALRAGSIIRNMRNFVRPAPRERRATDLNTLVAEVVELCGPECRQAQVALSLDLAADGPLSVRVDGIQIQQVLVNLVQNALHAMRGTPEEERRLVIRTTRADGCAQVEVRDTGSGFNVEDTESAFNAFYTTRPDGLGLGLAISRSIIHDHQGRLWAVSQRGQGARVLFSFPLALPDASRDRLDIADCLHR